MLFSVPFGGKYLLVYFVVGGSMGGGEGTTVSHAVVIKPLTTCPRESGALFLLERFITTANRSFLRCQESRERRKSEVYMQVPRAKVTKRH